MSKIQPKFGCEGEKERGVKTDFQISGVGNRVDMVPPLRQGKSEGDRSIHSLTHCITVDKLLARSL